MARNAHVDNAFRAMRAIGIDAAKVRRVLRKLLILYDGNWELIEEENYRALADAIFEEGPEVLDENPNANLENYDIVDSGSNSQLRQPGNKATPSSISITGPAMDTGTQLAKSAKKLIESHPGKGKEPVIDMNLPNGTLSPVGLPVQTSSLVQNCGKDICVPDIVTGEKRVGNFLDLETSAKRSYQPSTVSKQSSGIIDIGTSSSGEVKITVSCKFMQGRSKFDMPTKDEYLKFIEEKLECPTKTLDPRFSIKKFLNDMCELMLKLATDKSQTSQKCVTNTPGDGLNDDRVIINKSVPLPSQSKGKGLGYNFDIDDITKGGEKCEISFRSDVKEFPSVFFYMPQNVVAQTAVVKFTLAQTKDDTFCPDCVTDCCSSPSTCKCATDTNYGFAYTSEGLLKHSFLDDCISLTRNCKLQSFSFCTDCPLRRVENKNMEECMGHLVRKFIKECWIRCGCHKQCNNRVVQRGIKFKLQVFFSPERKRWGLRTLENLQKGSFVCEYAGEILTTREWYQRMNKRSTPTQAITYPVLLDAFWNLKDGVKDEEALCLDATYYGNVARFINHRCPDANLIEIPVKIEGPHHHYYHLALFTTRVVHAREELTWDYGTGICSRQPKATNDF